MEILFWIIGGLVLFLLGLFLLQVAIGYLVPPKITGRFYFRKVLKNAGILSSTLGDDCVEELFMHAYGLAEATYKFPQYFGEKPKSNLKAELVEFIDSTVRELQSRSMASRDPNIEKILVKHGHKFVVDPKDFTGRYWTNEGICIGE